jgi:hypothetical protein
MEIEPLNDTNWLSNLIGESPRTSERRRQEGTGPDFVKVGKRVLYRLSDVEDWIRRNTFTSTAEARATKDAEAAEIAGRYKAVAQAEKADEIEAGRRRRERKSAAE